MTGQSAADHVSSRSRSRTSRARFGIETIRIRVSARKPGSAAKDVPEGLRREGARAAFDEMRRLAGGPWVMMLSAGAGKAEFPKLFLSHAIPGRQHRAISPGREERRKSGCDTLLRLSGLGGRCAAGLRDGFARLHCADLQCADRTQEPGDASCGAGIQRIGGTGGAQFSSGGNARASEPPATRDFGLMVRDLVDSSRHSGLMDAAGFGIDRGVGHAHGQMMMASPPRRGIGWWCRRWR